MQHQPHHSGAQPPATIHIEVRRLVIDADATYARFTEALSIGPATELERIWGYSERVGGELFAHRPDQTLTANDLELDTGLPPTGLNRTWFADGHRFVGNLARSGFDVTYTHLIHDGGYGTFCERIRSIGVLNIGEPVGITAARYPQWAHLVLGLIDAPEPGSCHRLGSVVLPVGHYLICANSAWGSWKLRAACRIDSVPSAGAVTAVPGTQVDRITATCNQCTVSWTASSGALLFVPDPGHRARKWDFHDATGREQSGVDCPNWSCAGRVSFTN